MATRPDKATIFVQARECARNRGGELLSSDFRGADNKYDWRCANGHEWQATLRKVVSGGTWCAVCAGLRPDKARRFEDAKKIARSRGGELLSTKYRGVDDVLRWRCEKGHEWSASFYSVVARRKWCAVCAGVASIPAVRLEEARALAVSRGGLYLSEQFLGVKNSALWQCAQGHRWKASLSNITKGKWCPWCAGNKVDAAEQLRRAQDAAESRGGELLSTNYVGNKAPMRWRCAAGHEWEAAFATVVSRRTWCGRCGGTERDAEEQLAKARAAARSKEGLCLSTRYERANRSSMQWQCERGHRWSADFDSVVHAGSWCPVCSAGLRERLARHAFETLLERPFKKARPSWLRNPKTGRGLELDGFNAELGLAFEYQGDQHYKVVKPFKMDDARLQRQQYRDALKKRLCTEHGVQLCEVPNTVESSALPKWVFDELSRYDGLRERLKPWESVQTKEWLASDHYSIDDLQSVARERDGECLSPTYLGTRDKHRWRCANAHEWLAIWDGVRRGSWCPLCSGNIVDAHARLAEAQAAATGRNGRCLSTVYQGAQVKILWECKEGHRWQTRWYNVVRLKTWCRVCAHATRDATISEA